MSNSARYRQKAREFEQRENWKRAIEAYELAIEADQMERKEVDLALYNRVGDLYRRIGDINRAVEYYEMAVDGHLAAGFYNNAIALCNKILRNQPNHHSAYLKLGKIAAAKGFLSDARKHFLEYAERMQRAGQLDEAFKALVEFANLSPDPDVRLMIADQLVEHDRTSMAVDQLRLAWRDLVQDGREADAREVRERILQMAPDRDPEIDPPEEAAVAEVDAEGVIDLPEISLYDEPEARPAEEAASAGAEAAPEEPAAAEGPWQVETEGGWPAEGVGADAEVETEGVDLPDVELAQDEPESESLEIVPTTISGAEAEEGPPAGQEVEIVPTTLAGAEAHDGRGVGKSEAGVAVTGPPAEPLTPAERAAQLEARLEAEGRDPGLLVEIGEALLETGERERATERLQEALELFEARGELEEARRVVGELLRLDVNDVRAYQKRVELALKAKDRGAVIEAYLDLADCLDRTDASGKSRAIYKRVLEIDPGNRRAAAALEMMRGEKAAPPGDGQPVRGGYVDLGALVIDEEQAEPKSTRFRIPASDPQSESDVNFDEMLKQFRAKVAEAIDTEDAASHYDLGLAFKDMGLIDEAITEFQVAARTPAYRLRAIEMLGSCFIEKEEYRIALKVLSRALQVPGHTDEDLVGIFYALGQSYEALGERRAALECYERVLGCDVNFKDVSQRVAALRH
jgi:tetratricopeptide (TPR) repeat protein